MLDNAVTVYVGSNPKVSIAGKRPANAMDTNVPRTALIGRRLPVSAKAVTAIILSTDDVHCSGSYLCASVVEDIHSIGGDSRQYGIHLVKTLHPQFTVAETKENQ